MAEPLTDAERIRRLELLVAFLCEKAGFGRATPFESNVLREEVQGRKEWAEFQAVIKASD